MIDLKIDRLERLLAALGSPETHLPPVLHVAGTNGKGSVCAIARAVAEAAGLRVHVFTSPHLVRFNERIRLAGKLVTDEQLAEALDAIEAANQTNEITVFEAITAAAFWLFARIPADLCIVEVGLGGRMDATNVVSPAACAITSISLDHQEFLG
ncbi:MAG: bifunctional folylpolyglutamate synthase/dihydrofolate synthase, partial [Rhodospirillales bacterium]|nr:bifunctional folylpolyglutamate synthase/dihydrofolate synthase [Rhodospirillales bacterium]